MKRMRERFFDAVHKYHPFLNHKSSKSLLEDCVATKFPAFVVSTLCWAVLTLLEAADSSPTAGDLADDSWLAEITVRL